MHARLVRALLRPSLRHSVAVVALLAACGGDDNGNDPPAAAALGTSATANVFVPPTLTVARGQAVNITLGPTHNLDFENAGIADLMTFGATGTRSFSAAGTYRYRCPEHSTSYTEGMVGTIVVQ